MKPNEFKKILKPLIKQTIREVLFEEGVLSKVVSEVAAGLNNTIVETQKVSKPSAEPVVNNKKKEKLYEKQRQERIKRLNESTGLGAEVFSDVTEMSEPNSNSPLSGVTPVDAGVDISAIEKLSNGKWKTLSGGK